MSKRKRKTISDILNSITTNVYYSSDINTKMKYPCVRYELTSRNNTYADNNKYITSLTYQLIVIANTNIDPIFDKIASLNRCEMSRAYSSDGLHQEIYTITII